MSDEIKPVELSDGSHFIPLRKPLYEEFERVANENNTTIGDVVGKFFKLGFFATECAKSTESALIVRQLGNEDQNLIMFDNPAPEEHGSALITKEEWLSMYDTNTYTPDDGSAYWVEDGVETKDSAFEPPKNKDAVTGVRLYPV